MTKPTVVVDTTELKNTRFLTGGSWKELLDRVKKGHVRLAVSAIVIRESARQLREELEAGVPRTTSTLQLLAALGCGSEPDLALIDSCVKNSESQYIETIRSRLTDGGAEVLPVPSIPHESLLDRDFTCRKPFSRKGTGYRDALIWESLIEFLRHDAATGDVYFVSRNTQDYCDEGKKGDFARSLRAELAEIGTAERVRLVDSIGTAIKELREEFERLDKAPDAPPEPDLRGLVEPAVVAATDGLADGSDIETYGTTYAVDAPGDVDGISIESIDPRGDSVDYTVYKRYEGDTYAVRASIEADAHLEGFMYKADYYLTNSEVSVNDSDWNDHMMLVGFERSIRCWFDLLVVGGEVQNIELESVEVA